MDNRALGAPGNRALHAATIKVEQKTAAPQGERTTIRQY